MTNSSLEIKIEQPRDVMVAVSFFLEYECTTCLIDATSPFATMLLRQLLLEAREFNLPWPVIIYAEPYWRVTAFNAVERSPSVYPERKAVDQT